VLPQPEIVISDSTGHFKFQNLHPGTYIIVVRSDGVVHQEIKFTIAAGERKSDLVIALTKSGVVRGRIVNSRGNPVGRLEVTLLKIVFSQGQRIFTEYQDLAVPTRTNDRGEYLLGTDIPSGEYYVVAFHRAVIGSSPGPEDQYVRTYFPGTVSAAAAQSISVHAGSESIADFTIQSLPTVTVSGIVNSSIRTAEERTGGFFLVPRIGGVPGELLELMLNTYRPKIGTATPNGFEIRGVVPGSYYLFPYLMDTSNPALTYTERVPIEVGSKDLRGVVATVHRRPDVMGRVVINAGDSSGKTIRTDTLRLRMVARDDLPPVLLGQLGQSNSDGIVDSSGNFHFNNVPEALISLDVLGLPDFAYVMDLRFGGRSIFDAATFKIGADSPPLLDVVIATHGAIVKGVVRSDTQRTYPNETVVLIPEPRLRQNMFLYKRVESDADGNFVIEGIAPGKYKLFAFEDIPAGAHKNEEYMKKYEMNGKELQVEQDDVVGVQINAIPGEH
jgi:hypothetical protein